MPSLVSSYVRITGASRRHQRDKPARHFERLVTIKNKYDPTNLFYSNQKHEATATV
jgi:hypothetical protein